jgi:hypothetical protein
MLDQVNATSPHRDQSQPADSGMGRFVCSIGTPGRWRQGHTNIILNDARATGRPCGGTLDEDHCACQV